MIGTSLVTMCFKTREPASLRRLSHGGHLPWILIIKRRVLLISSSDRFSIVAFSSFRIHTWGRSDIVPFIRLVFVSEHIRYCHFTLYLAPTNLKID